MVNRASVIDAVAREHDVNVFADLRPDNSRDNHNELLRIPMRVRLVAGRTTGLELADDHLQVFERPRRKEMLLETILWKGQHRTLRAA